MDRKVQGGQALEERRKANARKWIDAWYATEDENLAVLRQYLLPDLTRIVRQYVREYVEWVDDHPSLSPAVWQTVGRGWQWPSPGGHGVPRCGLWHYDEGRSCRYFMIYCDGFRICIDRRGGGALQNSVFAQDYRYRGQRRCHHLRRVFIQGRNHGVRLIDIADDYSVVGDSRDLLRIGQRMHQWQEYRAGRASKPL